MLHPAHESLHPSLVNWHTNTQLQVLTTSESLGWNDAKLFIEKQEAIHEYVKIPYLDDDIFGLLLEGSASTQIKFAGVSRNYRVKSPSLQLIPRFSEFEGRWDSSWTYGLIRIDREFVVNTAATTQRGDPEKTELLPTFYFGDPLLYQLGAELCNEMRNANPFGLLYAESLTNTLTLYLLRHYSNKRVLSEIARGGLTPAQLRTLDEYIYTHLEQRVSLADLAACIHVSVPHFERMFRATTHRPPYQYVLELKLEKARLLLASSRLSVSEIGLQCGFSNQSHFSAHFRRHFGVSPARFARSRRD